VVVLTVQLRSIAWSIPHLGVSCVNYNSSRIGAIAHNSNRGNSSRNNRSNSNNISSTVPLLHHCSRLPSSHHSSFLPATFHASTMGRWPLHSRMPPAQAKQLTVGSGTCGQSTEGPSEGSCTSDGPCQLHHCGGDSHGRRRASGYVLPQQISDYYSI
jgi:hypothetical protein